MASLHKLNILDHCRAQPSAPSMSGPSMSSPSQSQRGEDWQRLLSHTGPSGLGPNGGQDRMPGSPGGQTMMNPMGGPQWVCAAPKAAAHVIMAYLGTPALCIACLMYL